MNHNQRRRHTVSSCRTVAGHEAATVSAIRLSDVLPEHLMVTLPAALDDYVAVQRVAEMNSAPPATRSSS
jgi:hypothetical protein